MKRRILIGSLSGPNFYLLSHDGVPVRIPLSRVGIKARLRNGKARGKRANLMKTLLN